MAVDALNSQNLVYSYICQTNRVFLSLKNSQPQKTHSKKKKSMQNQNMTVESFIFRAKN